MKNLSMILAAGSLCAVLAGCSRVAEQPPGAKPAAAPPPASMAPITLRAVDAKGFAAIVAAHRGQVVLVDYWATWCDPCKKLLPHTVTLHRELAGQGLAVIAVSFDDADDELAARDFLAAQGAAFENLRADSGASARSFTDFNVENGTLPFMRLYDRSGKVRKEFFAPIKPQEIEHAVKEALTESAS